ncbi:ABC transporter permease [Roseomonas sp. KE2513]|uniref:ABC transporter permease n=1 Tax=Roseomonas sp. KE2513 TaxID=2479202 RepID=UPI0018DF5267|nr:ABC transporter permease [Roseomonas sp. KE2513]MBI0535273.1 ABC transporter permease [Roseomonas sp. KE2513]
MTALLSRFGTALAGFLVLLSFGAFAENFASPGNLSLILKDTAFLAVLAIGFTLALATAELDLSIADVASLAAVVTGALIQGGTMPALAVLAGLATGLGAGLVNGFAVTVLGVPSLIATLGTAAVARGFGFMITQGVAFVGRWPREFTGLARGSLLGVSNMIWWMAAIGLLAWVLLKRTRTGLHMLATGEADEAARLAGIRTRRMKRLGLVLAGLLAGVTAVLLAASLSSAAPNMAGDHFLYAIAAVLLGMTMIEPGRPNIPGTLLAAFMLKALGNGLVLLGAPYYAQDIALGVIITGSVALSSTVMRRAAFTKRLNLRTAA